MTSDDASREEQDAVAGSRTKRSGWVLLRDIAVIGLVALVAAVALKAFVLRAFSIPSGSMMNTLQISDRVLVNELQSWVFPLDRGDIVVFRDPGGWLPPAGEPEPASPLEAVLSFVGLSDDEEDGYLIKRVIGLPGDTIECCDSSGRLIVNGTPVDETAYLALPDGPAADAAFTVTVPAHSLWVMGDNRGNSLDSRAHLHDPRGGTVPESRVVGRAFARIWPLTQLGWVDSHPEVFKGVPKR